MNNSKVFRHIYFKQSAKILKRKEIAKQALANLIYYMTYGRLSQLYQSDLASR